MVSDTIAVLAGTLVAATSLAAPANAQAARFELLPAGTGQVWSPPVTWNIFSAALVDHQTKKLWSCKAEVPGVTGKCDMRATCRSDVYESAPPGTYSKAARGDAPQFQPVSMPGIWHLNEATGDVAFCAPCPGNYTCVEAKLIQHASPERLEPPERWRWRAQEPVDDR